MHRMNKAPDTFETLWNEPLLLPTSQNVPPKSKPINMAVPKRSAIYDLSRTNDFTERWVIFEI